MRRGYGYEDLLCYLGQKEDGTRGMAFTGCYSMLGTQMTILVCGARDWDEPVKIRKALAVYRKVQPTVKIIDGAAPGADTFAYLLAVSLGYGTQRFPADWKRYGRAAGPIRNRQMLTEGKPDLVLAFHHDLNKSKGTKDMVARARKAGIRVQIFS